MRRQLEGRYFVPIVIFVVCFALGCKTTGSWWCPAHATVDFGECATWQHSRIVDYQQRRGKTPPRTIAFIWLNEHLNGYSCKNVEYEGVVAGEAPDEVGDCERIVARQYTLPTELVADLGPDSEHLIWVVQEVDGDRSSDGNTEDRGDFYDNGCTFKGRFTHSDCGDAVDCLPITGSMVWYRIDPERCEACFANRGPDGDFRGCGGTESSTD